MFGPGENWNWGFSGLLLVVLQDVDPNVGDAGMLRCCGIAGGGWEGGRVGASREAHRRWK